VFNIGNNQDSYDSGQGECVDSHVTKAFI